MQDDLLHYSLRRITQFVMIIVLPVLLTVGCVVIPIPTGEKPYPREKPYYSRSVESLEIGVTRKDEVISDFGVPDEVYAQGSELVYIDTVESLKTFWGYIVPIKGAPADFGVKTRHKRHVLLLSFDEKNVLAQFELATAGEHFGNCTGNGICVNGSNSFMRYADELSESEAKEFRVVEGMCSIYLHGPGNENAYEVSLDGKKRVNIFSNSAFFHWITEPGQQSIAIWPESVFLYFDCRKGEIAFLHYDYHQTKPSKLKLEDKAMGRKHISTRRLVLLPTGSHGLPLPPLAFQTEIE